MEAAARRHNEKNFSRIWGETASRLIDSRGGDKPKGRPIGQNENLELKAWPWVKQKLDELYPFFTYDPDSEGRMVLQVPAPSQDAIKAWEDLTWYEQREIAPLMAVPGPKVRLIGISTGWIPYKTDVLTEKKPPRLVARSLVSVIKASVEWGVFSYRQAERKFALKFQGVQVGKVWMDVEPLAWNKKREEAAIITTGA